MADLRMEMSEPACRLQYRVIYGDTDAGSIVYYANYLRFMEIGRNELMRNLAVPYSEIERDGIIIPVTECHLRYKAPAHYDDLITIATCLAELTRWSCRFHYRISCQREDKDLHGSLSQNWLTVFYQTCLHQPPRKAGVFL